MTCVRIAVSSLQQQQPSRGQASLLSFPKPPSGYLLSPNDRSILERRLRQNRHVSYVASWGTREERKSKSAQPPTAGDGGDVSLSWIYNHFEIYLRSKKTFSCPHVEPLNAVGEGHHPEILTGYWLFGPHDSAPEFPERLRTQGEEAVTQQLTHFLTVNFT